MAKIANAVKAVNNNGFPQELAASPRPGHRNGAGLGSITARLAAWVRSAMYSPATGPRPGRADTPLKTL